MGSLQWRALLQAHNNGTTAGQHRVAAAKERQQSAVDSFSAVEGATGSKCQGATISVFYISVTVSAL